MMSNQSSRREAQYLESNSLKMSFTYIYQCHLNKRPRDESFVSLNIIVILSAADACLRNIYLWSARPPRPSILMRKHVLTAVIALRPRVAYALNETYAPPFGERGEALSTLRWAFKYHYSASKTWCFSCWRRRVLMRGLVYMSSRSSCRRVIWASPRRWLWLMAWCGSRARAAVGVYAFAAGLSKWAKASIWGDALHTPLK